MGAAFGQAYPPTCDDVEFVTDGRIGGADLGFFLSRWGSVATGGSPAPPELGVLLALWNADGSPNGAGLTDDGLVNSADLGLLIGAWGLCP